ncbi:hypothetical protein FNJ84_14575 [Paracoccus sp. M683]|uniref:hypothetical protein n=1 Tax=Paracoccus sp. M683 TaxID=2594268 RepID=UPI001180E609|nr:hypothetical protein [Paracoccus sp. M683]TRW96062.1 hypothetical protein FNJ84_14575 [Paracoccus sp. M683]
MTDQAIDRQLKIARDSIMTGRISDAARDVDKLLSLIQRVELDSARRQRLETRLKDLRELAEAALNGARGAAEQLQAIIQSARSLETYDSHGQRKISDTATAQPRRF